MQVMQWYPICSYYIDKTLFLSGWYSSSYIVHFYVSISIVLVLVYMFSIHVMWHVWQCCDMHLIVKWYSVLLYEQIAQRWLEKLNCMFWVKHSVINESLLLPCRCAVHDRVCELCVILYDVICYCFEILLA